MGGDKGEGRSEQTVTKCDKGEEGGSKIGGRPVTYFLNGPYKTIAEKIIKNLQIYNGSISKYIYFRAYQGFASKFM